MFVAQTAEQAKIRAWLEEQFQPDELRAMEIVTRNAVRIVDRYHDTALVVCRQDGTVEIVSDDAEAC
ncbi:hypothetical protein [uncultured Intestinimonas sp.]|uniref:hypothetical protein n=1 Tax=uncultured Intestinimonas sp. TaxID=1689265 RepID=UPI0025D0A0E9|nr:hypothetical protein [uncultured Intestinimonas sp.]